MKIRLYETERTDEVEVPYEKATELPEIVFRVTTDGYKFYRRGYAANSTMFFETVALDVTGS